MRAIVKAAISVTIAGCTVAAAAANTGTIESSPFGQLPDGTDVVRYTLRNAHGMQATISTYGGIMTSLTAPDRHGNYDDVVLGYDNLPAYLKSSPYFGALIGRYGNRIAGARFTLDGHRYSIAANDGANSLHGGDRGFDKVVWKVEKAAISQFGPQLTLRYISVDGEEGYPGNLTVMARYTLMKDDAIQIEFSATSDKNTVVNLTDHTYFNLRAKGDILGHVLQIHAGRFTPIDKALIPTGELRDVTGTPFDFRVPAPIGRRINQLDDQLVYGKGYDHNWVIDHLNGASTVQASVYEPETGRVLEVVSAEPGLQFYSGNFLDGSLVGKNERRYEYRSGFCLEPQHFPDSPNRPLFPSTELKAGQTYRNTIVYRFTTR